MKLDVARLCLDCEEIHDEQICPSCSSEAFAFLTRWIERSTEPRPEPRRPKTRTVDAAAAANHEQVEAYRQLLTGQAPPRRSGMLAKSLVGLAAFGLAGWAYRAARRDPAARPQDGADAPDGRETGDAPQHAGEAASEYPED